MSGPSSVLSSIPIERRRLLAATLGLFAMLFITMGLVALTGRPSATIHFFSAVTFVVAGLLGLIAWGVAHTVHIDMAEQRLRRAIDATLARYGGAEVAFGCGHEHDPTETRITDATCAQDGHGRDCTHSCASCLRSTLRPSPTQSRSQRLAH